MTLPRRIRKKAQKERGPLRSPGHLKWVREHGCSVPECAVVWPIEAAHVRSGLAGGIGVKPPDDAAISLCGRSVGVEGHHAEQHRIGEKAFEKKYGIDMKALAQEFAAKSPVLRNRKKRVA